jgi:hypothetical protein
VPRTPFQMCHLGNACVDVCNKLQSIKVRFTAQLNVGFFAIRYDEAARRWDLEETKRKCQVGGDAVVAAVSWDCGSCGCRVG